MNSFLVGLMLCSALSAPFQGLDLRSLFSGQSPMPLVYSVADLPDDFSAVKVQFGGKGMDLFGGMTGMFMGMMGSFGGGGGEQDPEQAAAMKFFTYMEISWTKGETARIGTNEFLVTYKFDFDMSMMMGEGPPDLSKMPLRLHLVKLDAIEALVPRPDLKKSDLLGLASFPAVNSRAKQSSGLSSAKQLALGMILYTSDWDDVFPWPQSTSKVQEVIEPYLKNDRVWETGNSESSRFLFNMNLGGVSYADIESPAETPMFFESKPWPDGRRIVAFADGSAKLVSADDWSSVEEGLKLKFKRTAKQPLPPR
ncbi:MAG: hypothetical protein HND43_04360 [Armatimonadetes bacterium]|nr:hypothetical protein [Armatimonadota bacterium]GIK31146.1 MAG: hypothetical protein BroJett009_01380 [Armatimonadota bacterium]